MTPGLLQGQRVILNNKGLERARSDYFRFGYCDRRFIRFYFWDSSNFWLQLLFQSVFQIEWMQEGETNKSIHKSENIWSVSQPSFSNTVLFCKGWRVALNGREHYQKLIVL